jgi:hypothetical protein
MWGGGSGWQLLDLALCQSPFGAGLTVGKGGGCCTLLCFYSISLINFLLSSSVGVLNWAHEFKLNDTASSKRSLLWTNVLGTLESLKTSTPCAPTYDTYLSVKFTNEESRLSSSGTRNKCQDKERRGVCSCLFLIPSIPTNGTCTVTKNEPISMLWLLGTLVC